MLTCGVCGEENPDRARFCLNCAAPLAPDPIGATEERKIVTVLFCDLVGFTSRAERSDPEDVRQLLDAYHAQLRREIERFAGTIEKFIGDAVMAVFGAPVSHEDDAERGVRAALRILDAVAELNDARPGLDLAVRIGVNTGEAVVALGGRSAQGQGMATGDVVNTASRLQTIAPEGAVVVGEATYRATREVIEYRDLEAVALKGKAEPVPIWLALVARSRFGIDVDQRASTPFLGRGNELALLQGTFERSVAESSIQLVTVTGEPGVGKSRLLWEFKTALDDDPNVLASWRQGRCLPYGDGITFWALGEMVKGQAGILESDGPEEASVKLAIAVSTVIDDPLQSEWVKARLSGLVGIATGQADRRESFAAWRTFLEAITSRGPLVLVFEDLHWADEALVEFLDHLVEWATDAPILVVCTARPELYERHPGWGGGKRNATTLALSRLSDEDTARLVFALLAQVALPADVQRALLERAGGNPLFAEEYVRMLLDRGILQRRGRTLVMAPDAEIPLPDSIQATIAARLDTLPPGRKSLLHDAAVIGKVFWSGALASIGELDEQAVNDGLHVLSRKELVRRSRTSSVDGQVEYAFWHALVRDVAYAQIPRATRSRKHRQAATWIKSISGDRVADASELLAYHLEEALSLAQAAGLDADIAGLREETREALQWAGDRALNLDSRQAYAFYRRGLELAPPGTAERGRLLLGVVVGGTGAFGGSGQLEPKEGERLLAQAVGELRAAGDPLGFAEALILLSRQHWLRGAPEPSREALTEAIAVLEPGPATRELAEAYTEMTGREMLAGRWAEARSVGDKALSLADAVGARDVYARALQFRGTFRIVIDGDLGGLTDLREALALALEAGRFSVIEPAYDNLADFVHDVEGPELGLSIYREGIEFMRRRGAPALWLLGESTWPLFSVGRWDEMLRVADEVLEADRTDGSTQLTGLVAPEKARVLTYRGRASEARELIGDYLARAREVRDPQILVRSLLAGAVAAMGLDDRRGAIALMEELAELGIPLDRYWALPEGARILVQAGALDLAERLVEGDGSVPTMPNVRAAVDYGRATIHEAAGRHDEALALYVAAAAWWDARGFVYNEAQAILGSARCEASLGAVAEAAARLHRVAGIFEQLGARALMPAVDRLTEALAMRDRARYG